MVIALRIFHFIFNTVWLRSNTSSMVNILGKGLVWIWACLGIRSLELFGYILNLKTNLSENWKSIVVNAASCSVEILNHNYADINNYCSSLFYLGPVIMNIFRWIHSSIRKFDPNGTFWRIRVPKRFGRVTRISVNG